MAQDFTPSPQQIDFFDFVDTGTGSAVLEAVAGAGKSTTLLEAVRRMDGDVFLGAFNTRIAKELSDKANERGIWREGVRFATMHSAGYKAWMYKYKDCKLDNKKVQRILDAAMIKKPEIADVVSAVLKMVSIGKQTLIEASNTQAWLDIIDRYNLDESIPEDIDPIRVANLAAWTFNQSHKQCPTIIDFDDMIYAPVAYRIRMLQNDWVLLDEAQDTNPARRALARKMLRPGGRLVAVGDSGQAIYAFTGADTGALDLIAEEFNAIRLPLTVSYRCPQAVVAEAQRYMPHIQAHPSAPLGQVEHLEATTEGTTWWETKGMLPTDAILCRYTKPLVEQAYAMLRKGVACRVEGRDIGSGLIQLVKRWKVRTLTALEGKLDLWLAREAQKAAMKNDETRLRNATDKVETINIFIARCRQLNKTDLQDLIEEIERLFADEVTGVTVLSTIHKAKGREWGRVFLLITTGMGRPSRQEWEIKSEICCDYVARTRSKEYLGYVRI